MNRYPLIKASIVCDTISSDDARITTLEITYPRPFLAEFNTHGVVAKSTASSRAIPVAKRRADVAAHPYVPIFTVNKKGMQADAVLDDAAMAEAEDVWAEYMRAGLAASEKLEALGVHKQHANRVLEPFNYTTAVVTATEWTNFLALRASPEAQPEFEELAVKMREALHNSVPSPAYQSKSGEYHLPYVAFDEFREQTGETLSPVQQMLLVSAARCARVSYKSLKTGKLSTWEEDFQLARDLLKSGHMSPFDHPAKADSMERLNLYRGGDALYRWANGDMQGRFFGWLPYRNLIEADMGKISRRMSTQPFTLPLKSGI